jgi:UrcA family protein
MNKSVLALAAMASAFVSAPAFADVVSTTAVQYGDLNLASPAGRQTLNRRISNAARSVCHVRSDDRSLASRIERNKCYDRAVSGALQQVASLVSGFAIASR